ncbi:histidine--tRNA ligase, partial [Desulfobacteraceae bacterium SEEP-SAG9]
DVQLIFLLMTLFARLAVKDIKAHINSLGCPACRPGFRQVLSDFLVDISDNLCSDCVRRHHRNPLRVLDCKVPTCREAVTEAPSILSSLCPDCARDFEILTESLERLGIPFVIDKRLVRGLDYYTRATFEIQTESIGAQSAVAGGGRYDGLIKALGGPDLPATGFAIGFDRLAEISGLKVEDLIQKPDIFIAAL